MVVIVTVIFSVPHHFFLTSMTVAAKKIFQPHHQPHQTHAFQHALQTTLKAVTVNAPVPLTANSHLLLTSMIAAVNVIKTLIVLMIADWTLTCVFVSKRNVHHILSMILIHLNAIVIKAIS
jgi:hypothetical protein